MQCRRYHPSPDLEPWLAHCWEWRFNKSHVIPEIFPGTGAEILFNLGDNISITSVSRLGFSESFSVNSGAAVLLCPRHAHLSFSASGCIHILSLRLRSASCFELFGIPLEHISDQVLQLDELGISLPAIELVYEQGAGALGQWMRQQLARRPRRELDLLRPIEKLYHGLSYSEFLQLSGISPRTLQRQFRSYIGVDARYFQRTARFQRTLRKLLTGTPLLDTLLDGGYCDQSHFIKSCQFFTQRSPGHLLTPEQMTLNHYNPQISRLAGFI
ncbi:AraC family transcriptional regulator [Yersinia canariae]|uniref:AraC family transcriptional regulator n=1 Tax=Yersinia canariae TaxID=2607663 RepID=A0A857EXF3_9GAMM|nr:AraC family transcriptional regulator [Yersinia canariae]